MEQKLEDYLHGLLPYEIDEVSQEYRKYLEKGLPKSPLGVNEKKRVLIIGCGITGMVSAALSKIIEPPNRNEKIKICGVAFFYCQKYSQLL